ncbi:MAG: carboxypeptidase-like regulatory domain-containing protein, partial [Thermoplasmatales archaeon]|nr:carboxypeptidase-like regulatory domain-containing protein [Thermoplasmatales archaeon]
DVETIADFHVDSNGSVYFKLLAHDSNDALNEGWWVHYLVYENNTLIKDLGNKSGNDATGYVSVEAYKTYTLKAFIHMPGNLSVNRSYQCTILLCEHSGAVGGSGGTIDDSEKFILSITPTTMYLIYGHVYDKDKKPVPNIDVSITNMETGSPALTKTNNTGFYSYNLYNSGYHNNDNIRVEATYNNITGYSLTTVNIENNGSECNIVIPASTTYLIYGHVYDKNGKIIPNIDVNITNMETGKSALTKTNNTGFYSYNLYNLGYHDNDRIMVSATYKNITGHNMTTVNIENNCSECNIVIPTSVTGKLEEDNIIWVITGVMVGVGIAVSIIFIRR